jgi:hypothetical protein
MKICTGSGGMSGKNFITEILRRLPVPEVNTMTEAVQQVFNSMKPGTFFYGKQLEEHSVIKGGK